MKERMIEQKQIKIIWASAKEYGIDRQGVYDIIFAVASKEHMTQLTYFEADRVITRIKGSTYSAANQKRTDEGGAPETVALRRKIYVLTGKLGWNNDNNRINGFVKKMCNVERVEWLTVRQCHMVIEALKKILERQEV